MQDRRLDQDDNRGLGQGVQDNVPVLNIFKLGLENIRSCVKRSDKYRGGYQTTAMHTEMNRLLYPMEKLVWHDNDWIGVQPQFGEERWPLETGTEIAVLRNLKHVATNASKKSTMGLVINRVHLEQCDGDDSPTETVRHLFRFESDFVFYDLLFFISFYSPDKSTPNAWDQSKCRYFQCISNFITEKIKTYFIVTNYLPYANQSIHHKQMKENR